MTVWFITVVTVAAIIIGRVISYFHKCTTGKHHTFIEIGSERAEFWIPGDPGINADDFDYDDFDYDDFEDL